MHEFASSSSASNAANYGFCGKRRDSSRHQTIPESPPTHKLPGRPENRLICIPYHMHTSTAAKWYITTFPCVSQTSYTTLNLLPILFPPLIHPLQPEIPSTRSLHQRSIPLPPNNIQHPLLNLPQPIPLIPHKINPILSTHQILRGIWLLSLPRRTMLCQRVSSKRSSISSILNVHADVADRMRGIHGSDVIEDLCADGGEAVDDSSVIRV
jgi:hypothetical protein